MLSFAAISWLTAWLAAISILLADIRVLLHILEFIDTTKVSRGSHLQLRPHSQAEPFSVDLIIAATYNRWEAK
ncbi:uncharacterized [Tachysurus ichikawai]